MYCPKCGTENPDGAQLCRNCSWVLTSISTITSNPKAVTSRLAITALVLGILSILFSFITAIPALIFGIVGLVKIRDSQGQLKGKGLAIAGIAVSAFFILTFMLAILLPALSQVRITAQRVVCASNMAGLGKAMMIYANDSNGTYPTSSKWCDLLTDYADVTKESFVCKGASEGQCSYAMNKSIEKLGGSAPPDMVLLFESKPGWNQSGGPELLTTDNHKGQGCNILFNDGHVEFVKIKDINNLKWTPGHINLLSH